MLQNPLRIPKVPVRCGVAILGNTDCSWKKATVQSWQIEYETEQGWTR